MIMSVCWTQVGERYENAERWGTRNADGAQTRAQSNGERTMNVIVGKSRVFSLLLESCSQQYQILIFTRSAPKKFFSEYFENDKELLNTCLTKNVKNRKEKGLPPLFKDLRRAKVFLKKLFDYQYFVMIKEAKLFLRTIEL